MFLSDRSKTIERSSDTFFCFGRREQRTFFELQFKFLLFLLILGNVIAGHLIFPPSSDSGSVFFSGFPKCSLELIIEVERKRPPSAHV